MSNPFAGQELEQLIKDCRRTVEGYPQERSIGEDLQPSIMLGAYRMHEDAILPKYAHEGDGCFDLHCHSVTYPEVSIALIKTGLRFEIPKGYALMVYSRSGQGFNHDVRLSNCVGVIDSVYRGELLVKLTADNIRGWDYLDNIKPGDRIAQAMLVPVPHVTIVEFQELSETARGENGLGSTGK